MSYGFLFKDLDLTRSECGQILYRKINILVKKLREEVFFFDMLSADLKVVLIIMAYQMGIKGLLKFKKFLKRLLLQDYAMAAEEMLDSTWAKQTPERPKELADVVMSHSQNSNTLFK